MIDSKARALGLDTLFTGVAIGYVFLFLALVWLVVVVAKSNKARAIGTAIVFLVFGALPFWIFVYETPVEKEYRAKQVAEQQEWRVRYAAAKPIFDEKCKTSGERIYRVAEDVEGVFLPKVRQGIEGKIERETLKNQMWDEAALPYGEAGEKYIRSFLLDRVWRECCGAGTAVRRYVANGVDTGSERGFLYVDIIHKETGQRLRVTATMKRAHPDSSQAQATLEMSLAAGPLPRYSVTYENNVDPELRKHWIAGTTIKVVDEQTNETMGELEIWRFDNSLGRTPWSPWSTSATTCPPYDESFGSITQQFTDKILKAKQRD